MSDQQTPQPLRIRKYPNRRFYDTTRSRHVTLRNLYELVRAGHAVTVTDSRTGEEITNAILLQMLLDRAPSKVELLPSAFLHQMLRADRHDLRSMVEARFRPPPRQGSPGARAEAAELGPTGVCLPDSICVSATGSSTGGGPLLPTPEA